MKISSDIIVEYKINWRIEWAADPELIFLVKSMPDFTDAIYEYREGFYYTERNGFADFFYHDVYNENGYSGRSFKIQTEGGEKIVVGPWSSRPECINEIGFGPCANCLLTDNKSVFDRGYTLIPSYITEDLLLSLQEQMADDGVYLFKDRGAYIPSLRPDAKIKPTVLNLFQAHQNT